MANVGETVNIGGHMAKRVQARASESWQYECEDCGKRGDNALFTVGTHGCPGRPESLSETGLSVCPGGERCGGHMRQNSREFTAWKNSKSMSSDLVPRDKCSADEMGVRAARQYRTFADKVGMRMRVWSEQGIAGRVGAAGGTVAEFQHANGNGYVVSVDEFGRINVQEETR